MARDRKRAKQRQQRKERTRNSVAPSSSPVRRDVPGALDHASADVDEFDAALVAGAGGVPVSPEQTDQPDLGPDEQAAGQLAQASSSQDSAGDRDDIDDQEDVADLERDDESRRTRTHARERRQPLAGRTVAFMRACWAELQRVQWPDRPQVFQGTAVVLGFVTIAGLYLGGADLVAKEIVEFIL
ncbi:MAG: preprotein translocase subunit SecE [Solirubrobacteraceae bacterium]